VTRNKAALWLTVALDAILINVAFVLAYLIRYQLQLPTPVEEQFYAPFTPYVPFALLLTGLCLLMFRIDGLYNPNRRPRVLGEVYRVVNGTATSLIAVMAATFFTQPETYSRVMMVLAGVLVIILLSVSRLVQHAVIADRRRRGLGTDSVLVLGAGEVGRAVMRTILASPGLGYRITGYLDDDPEKQGGLGRIPSLGDLDRLDDILRQGEIDTVLVTLPWARHHRIMHVVDLCEVAGVRVRVVPDVFQRRMQNVDFETLNGIPLISPGPEVLSSSAFLLKRAVDVGVAVLTLPVFLIIYALSAALIKLDTPGPVIYRQKRIGKGGQEFELLKFRTMVDGADRMTAEVAHLSKYKDDTLIKIPDDPRMTRVGRLLRRLSIDELPQVINVLRGEMSLVGPRPNIPTEVAQYDAWQRKRLNVLPGMTGLWQVSGRSDVPFDEMCLLDIFYIENWSLGLDIRILLQTIPHILFGNGAY
jgi:exopolysaccharide biosynthesis polyprenyl glycosylphosphotransferase